MCSQYLFHYGYQVVFILPCFHPIYYPRPFFPPPIVTHVYRWVTIAGSSPSSSLVDSRRIVPTHARRSQHSILFLFLQICSTYHHGGIQTPHKKTINGNMNTVLNRPSGRPIVIPYVVWYEQVGVRTFEFSCKSSAAAAVRTNASR